MLRFVMAAVLERGERLHEVLDVAALLAFAACVAFLLGAISRTRKTQDTTMLSFLTMARYLQECGGEHTRKVGRVGESPPFVSCSGGRDGHGAR